MSAEKRGVTLWRACLGSTLSFYPCVDLPRQEVGWGKGRHLVVLVQSQCTSSLVLVARLAREVGLVRVSERLEGLKDGK